MEEPERTAARESAATRRYRQLAADVLDGLLETAPETATALGDHRFDDRLDDLSAGGRRRPGRACCTTRWPRSTASTTCRSTSPTGSTSRSCALPSPRTSGGSRSCASTSTTRSRTCRARPSTRCSPGTPGSRRRVQRRWRPGWPASRTASRWPGRSCTTCPGCTWRRRWRRPAGSWRCWARTSTPCSSARPPPAARWTPSAPPRPARSRTTPAGSRPACRTATATRGWASSGSPRKLWYALDTETSPDQLLTRAESDLQAVEEEIAEVASRIAGAPPRAGQVREVLDPIAASAPVDDSHDPAAVPRGAGRS